MLEDIKKELNYFAGRGGTDLQKNQYLMFKIEDENYGIEIKYVRDIIRIQKITHVPDTLKYFKGVINLRGKVVPVIDLHLRFGISETVYDDRTCIIVVSLNDILTGFIVDRVSEVMDISSNQLTNEVDSSVIGDKTHTKFIQAIA
ncbi:purine-binding chemotaxis protein CheW, partial [bacterium]|nr:purine-binding chemotaxis protein CheW [bacterium]